MFSGALSVVGFSPCLKDPASRATDSRSYNQGSPAAFLGVFHGVPLWIGTASAAQDPELLRFMRLSGIVDCRGDEGFGRGFEPRGLDGSVGDSRFGVSPVRLSSQWRRLMQGFGRGNACPWLASWGREGVHTYVRSSEHLGVCTPSPLLAARFGLLRPSLPWPCHRSMGRLRLRAARP